MEKKEAESPEVSKPAKSKSEKPNDDLNYVENTVGKSIEDLKVVTTELKTKVKGVEFSKSTTRTRLMKLETESSPVITAEAPDPTVTTEAAPPTEVTSEASKEPTIITPTAAEKNPAEEISEGDNEEATDEPMETFTKPVVANTPATEGPTPPVATEASPTLEPGGDKTALEDIEATLVVIPEQNRNRTKKVTKCTRHPVLSPTSHMLLLIPATLKPSRSFNQPCLLQPHLSLSCNLILMFLFRASVFY